VKQTVLFADRRLLFGHIWSTYVLRWQFPNDAMATVRDHTREWHLSCHHLT